MSPPSRAARIAAMRAVFAKLCDPDGAADDMFFELPEEEDDENIGGGKQSPAKAKLARDIAAAFAGRRKDINAMIAAAATYAPEEITLAERALICAGAAEMLARPKTPPAVVISEFVQIAEQYGIDGGAKLVNAVLDGVARRLRQARRDETA